MLMLLVSACIWFLLYNCRQAKSKLEAPTGNSLLSDSVPVKKEKPTSLKYHLLSNGCDFLIALAVSATFWGLLSALVDSANSDEASLEGLRRLEVTLHQLSGFANALKLGTETSLLVLVILFAASLWVRRKGEREAAMVDRGFRGFVGYAKWAKRATVLLTLLTSFTLFGATVKPQQLDLELRIRTAAEGFEAWQKALREGARHSAVRSVYTRTMHSARPSYRQAMTRWQQYHASRARLLQTYQSNESSLKSVQSKVEPMRTAAKQEAAAATFEEVAGAPGGAEPPGLTARRAAELRGRAADLRDRLSLEAAELLKTPIGRKMGTSGLGAMLSYKNAKPLQNLAAEFAIFGPVFDVVSTSFSNALVDKLDRLAVRYASSVNLARSSTSNRPAESHGIP